MERTAKVRGEPDGAGELLLRALAVWLIVLCLAGPALAAGKRALLISSYHPGFPTFFKQIEGVNSVLAPAGVELDVEYMDSKRFGAPKDIRAFRELLARKLARLPRYDVILTSDDNALRFAAENRPALFPDSPVVFFGVNDQALAHAQGDDDNFTGVIEAVSMEETLRVIFRLRPGTRTVHAVVDGTTSGGADLLTYLSKRSLFPDRNLAVLSLAELTWSELAQRTAALGEEDAILLLSAYRDAAGEAVSFREGLRRILSSTTVPVYDLWEHGLGLGAVGGKIISHFEQGWLAARLALAILGGVAVRDVPVIEGDEANRYVFDAQVLKQFGMDRNRLPEDTRFLNRKQSLWHTHRLELSLGVGAVAALTLMVCLLSGGGPT